MARTLKKNSYLLLLKCFGGKSGSQKVWPTAWISALTPQIMKNWSLRFSGWIRTYWSSLYFFLKKYFFGWIFAPADPSQPAQMDKSNHFFKFVFETFPKWANKFVVPLTSKRSQDLNMHPMDLYIVPKWTYLGWAAGSPINPK